MGIQLTLTQARYKIRISSGTYVDTSVKNNFFPTFSDIGKSFNDYIVGIDVITPYFKILHVVTAEIEIISNIIRQSVITGKQAVKLRISCIFLSEQRFVSLLIFRFEIFILWIYLFFFTPIIPPNIFKNIERKRFTRLMVIDDRIT